MLILDTDHLSAIDRSTSAGLALRERLSFAGVAFGISIVSVEEQLRGRLSRLSGKKAPQLLVEP